MAPEKATEKHPEAAVNHAQRDQGASEPNVHLHEEGTSLLLGKEVVMDHAADGLEEGDGEEDEADFGMIVVQLSHGQRQCVLRPKNCGERSRT